MPLAGWDRLQGCAPTAIRARALEPQEVGAMLLAVCRARQRLLGRAIFVARTFRTHAPHRLRYGRTPSIAHQRLGRWTSSQLATYGTSGSDSIACWTSASVSPW